MQLFGQTWLNLVTWTYGSWSEGQHDPYFMAQWSCIILKSVWCMYIILQDYESVWPEIWPQNKCRSLWPIFYGPVIWPYILNVIWCMNILIWDYESVWPDILPQSKMKVTSLPYTPNTYTHKRAGGGHLVLILNLVSVDDGVIVSCVQDISWASWQILI